MSIFLTILLVYFIYSYILKNNGYSINYSSKINEGDFEISLLILSAFVIKSDGRIDKNELSFVRNYFIQIYGEDYAKNIFSKFTRILQNSNISLKNVCDNLKNVMSYATKLQLLHYLFSIAKSDGKISDSEIITIKRISEFLFINDTDFNSIKSMFAISNDNLDSEYNILEVSKNSTDEQIKESYRKLAKLHHPDKVQHLGDKYVNGAKEKFSKIQNAYEKIRKERKF